MATDSLADLQKQVEADLTVVNSNVCGMEDQIISANTPELKAGLEDPPLAELNQRKVDLETILADIEKLYADIDVAESHGWPAAQIFTLPSVLMVEFIAQNRDLTAAAHLFKMPTPPGEAQQIVVNMGEPIDDVVPAPANS